MPAAGPGVNRASEMLDRFCAQNSIDEASVWHFQVALDEVLFNIVDHGYGDNPDGVIDLEFAVADGELEMTIIDDGPPFDILSLPDPDTSSALSDRPIGGLGVHFVRTLMDRASYARVDGRNRLVLARRVTSGR